MTDRRRPPSPIRLAVAAALLAGAAGLSGCAAVGDSVMSQAFVDPARYDLYDCKQLADERKDLDARMQKYEGLIRKAETGVAGPVVAELAYRNDYINVKARMRLLEQTWRENRCADAAAAPAAAASR